MEQPLNAALRTVDSLAVVRSIRPRVGRDTSLWMFRVAYYMAFLQSLGKDYVPWSLLAGRKFGKFFQIGSYEQMQAAFKAMKLGIVEILTVPNGLQIHVIDCMCCSGIIGLEEPACAFVGGLLAAIVQQISGRDLTVKETMCQGMNHPSCHFELDFTPETTAAG